MGDCGYFVQVLVIGDSGVGKTNIATQFSKGEFDLHSKTTIGVDFEFRSNIHVDDKIIKCHILDTASAERFRSLVTGFYRKSMGALIVYDITRKVTFENVKQWVKELRDTNPNIVVMLLGNKVDLSRCRVVQIDEAKAFSEREKVFFMETSALHAFNVEKAFTELIARIYCGNVLKVANEKYRLEDNGTSKWVMVPKTIHETYASKEIKKNESSEDTTSLDACCRIDRTEVAHELEPQEPQHLSKRNKEKHATSSVLPVENIKELIGSLNNLNATYEGIQKEKIRLSEKAIQHSSEREDFKILTTNTDHLTGATLQAAEMLKKKVAKKYGF